MSAASKVAFVTGAGSGIGRAVALKLQAAGYNVTLAGRRAEQLQETAAAAMPGGGRMLVAPADVSEPQSVLAAFHKHAETFSRLDVLFNNAGTFAVGTPIEDIALEDWRRVVDVNLTGAFICAQHAIRLMKAQSPKGGRIINNGSISAHVPRPNSAPYTATKHAMTGLTKSIALDGRAHAIACSQIDIGNAATELMGDPTKPSLQADGSHRVEPRMDVAHVADAVLYIANLPLDANVQFMTVMATAMPYIGRG